MAIILLHWRRGATLRPGINGAHTNQIVSRHCLGRIGSWRWRLFFRSRYRRFSSELPTQQSPRALGHVDDNKVLSLTKGRSLSKIAGQGSQ